MDRLDLPVFLEYKEYKDLPDHQDLLVLQVKEAKGVKLDHEEFLDPKDREANLAL